MQAEHEAQWSHDRDWMKVVWLFNIVFYLHHNYMLIFELLICGSPGYRAHSRFKSTPEQAVCGLLKAEHAVKRVMAFEIKCGHKSWPDWCLLLEKKHTYAVSGPDVTPLSTTLCSNYAMMSATWTKLISSNKQCSITSFRDKQNAKLL